MPERLPVAVQLALLVDESSTLERVLAILHKVGSERIVTVDPASSDVLVTDHWPLSSNDTPLAIRPVVLVTDECQDVPGLVCVSVKDGWPKWLWAVHRALEIGSPNEHRGGESLRSGCSPIAADTLVSMAESLSVPSYSPRWQVGKSECLVATSSGFDPARSLHDWCAHAIELARESGSNIRIEGLGIEWICLAGGRLVYVGADVPIVRSLAETPVVNDSLCIVVDGRELMVNDGDPQLHAADSLLWLLALSASSGRLPLGVSPDLPLKLQYWPNTPRLALPSCAERLFAYWHGEWATLKELVICTGLLPREVGLLVSACLLTRVAVAQETKVLPAESRFRGLWRRGS